MPHAGPWRRSAELLKLPGGSGRGCRCATGTKACTTSVPGVCGQWATAGSPGVDSPAFGCVKLSGPIASLFCIAAKVCSIPQRPRFSDLVLLSSLHLF